MADHTLELTDDELAHLYVLLYSRKKRQSLSAEVHSVINKLERLLDGK